MTCSDQTYKWDGEPKEYAPKTVSEIVRLAEENGWEVRATCNDEHQSLVVRFRRPDALPGYISWKDRKAAGAVVSNWPWWVRSGGLVALIYHTLGVKDIKAYLQDPEVIYPDDPEDLLERGFATY